MDNCTVISVEGLYKKFCISQKKTMLYGGLDIVRSMIGMPQRRDTLRDHEIWALQDINIEAMRGDSGYPLHEYCTENQRGHGSLQRRSISARGR